jgi:RNA polymerase sigma-70 factor (ECF subfamily)
VELIQRCKAGDANAFALLFEQYKNLVYRTAYLILNDGLGAEDVLQEVFLKVHGSLHTYEPKKGAFTTWLHRITVNYCLNLRRRHFFDFLSWEADLPEARQMKVPSAEDEAEDGDIHKALQQLSPKLRAVIVLYYYNGLTYSEISQVLGVRIGTVESRINQALKNIRRTMNMTSIGDRVFQGEEVES